MQINPQSISVEQGSMQEGADFIGETSQRINTQCNELEEANERICKELEGNIKVCFQSAASATSLKIKIACGKLNALSVLASDYTRQMTEVDMSAARHGGGGASR